MYTITVGTWVNGSPTTIRSIECDASNDEWALDLADQIARDYDINHCVYVYQNDRRIGYVNIFAYGRRQIVTN